MKNLQPMKPTLTILTTLLLAPLAALPAAEPASNLHPYVTAGDPNIGRAFRIAVGDIASNLAPLDGAATLTAAPLNKKRWEALSAKVVEIAGTRRSELPRAGRSEGSVDQHT
jgi:hypothetical protein